MTTTLNNFVSETQLTTSEVTLMSTLSSETKFIGKATVTNTSDANVAGTIGSGGNWIWKHPVPAGGTVNIDKIMGHNLGGSMKISGLAGVAGVINIDISGTTES